MNRTDVPRDTKQDCALFQFKNFVVKP